MKEVDTLFPELYSKARTARLRVKNQLGKKILLHIWSSYKIEWVEYTFDRLFKWLDNSNYAELKNKKWIIKNIKEGDYFTY